MTIEPASHHALKDIPHTDDTTIVDRTRLGKVKATEDASVIA